MNDIKSDDLLSDDGKQTKRGLLATGGVVGAILASACCVAAAPASDAGRIRGMDRQSDGP
tara:strand:+ start:931 stop:1110 length:180 start_codon:yes stop_codon:yes gene_type:complete